MTYLITTLDPDDGDAGRQQRGLAIAAFGSRSEGPPWLQCTRAVQQWFLHSCEVEKEDEVDVIWTFA